jgi:hypothetical protein
MNWGRKGALAMLTVVAFWATMPTFACLLGTRHASQPNCCRAMAQTCDSPATGADSSCCRIQGNNPAVAPVPPFSVGHSQNLAVVARQAGLELPAAPGGAYRNVLETPPPKFPPGGAFSLRI